jgi:MFS family permease
LQCLDPPLIRGAVLRPPLPVVGLVVLALTMTSFMRGPLLPGIGRDLELDAAQLSLLTSAFAIGRLCMDLPAGRLADRLPAAVSLGAAGLVVAGASAAVAVAGSLGHVAAAMAFLGAGSALANTTGMTVFSSHGPATSRGTAMALFSTALMTGQMLGPALAGLLADLASWRVAQLAGVIAGLGAAGACLVVRRAAVRGAPPRRPRAHADLEAMSRVEAAAIASVAFSGFFALGALPQTLLPVMFEAELSFSAGLVGLALAAAGLARLLGGLVSGRLSDRVSRRAALIPMAVVMGLSIGLLALPPSAAVWLVALVLLSFCSSGVSVGATIVADRADPAVLGRRLGTFRLAGDAGLLVGPAVAGFLYQHAGRGEAVLAVGAVVLASATACALTVAESRPSRMAV